MIRALVSNPDHCPNTETLIWEEFVNWIEYRPVFQFDIETNVTSFWCTKELKTLQFGDYSGEDQIVLEVSVLTMEQMDYIKSKLESWDVLKLIHNAAFEYIVMKFYGIEIHNVHCTMVTEKIISKDVDGQFFSLGELTWKYCGVNLDKTLQTSFGEGYLTDEKIQYAATDVMYLGTIKDGQDVEIDQWGLKNTLWLEMRSLLAFSDCTFYGVGLDVEKWKGLAHVGEPVVAQAEKNLNSCLLDDSRLLSKAVTLGYYKTEDTPVFNLNSPTQKLQILKLLFPDLEGSSLSILKKYIRDKGPTLDSTKLNLLMDLLEKKTDSLCNYAVAHHREELIAMDMLLPKGSVTINWNSQQQALAVLQGVEPRLKNLSEEALAKTTHEVFQRLIEYKTALKLLSSFGEAFVEKFVEPDGKVRTNYNQVVSTGRASSAKPNMQQIPAYEAVGTAYRNCFIYTPGWKFVDSDYTGQELCLIAHASQDDVWYKAIEKGEDLHSVTAAMVFGAKWDSATQEGCVYKSDKQKCKCSGHKTLRNAIKTINFG